MWLEVLLVISIAGVIVAAIKDSHMPGKFMVENINPVAVKIGRVKAARPCAHGFARTVELLDSYAVLSLG